MCELSHSLQHTRRVDPPQRTLQHTLQHALQNCNTHCSKHCEWTHSSSSFQRLPFFISVVPLLRKKDKESKHTVTRQWCTCSARSIRARRWGYASVRGGRSRSARRTERASCGSRRDTRWHGRSARAGARCGPPRSSLGRLQSSSGRQGATKKHTM